MTKRLTAAELKAELEKDSEFVAAQRRRDAEAAQRRRTFREQEQPLVAELNSAGIAVESVWDLVNDPGDYQAAVPVLLANLDREYPTEIREGIARALGTPAARPYWDALVRSYQSESDARVRDGLAAALAAMATNDHLGAVMHLAENRENGPSRVLLLRALARSEIGRAELQKLKNDPELSEEATFLLRTP